MESFKVLVILFLQNEVFCDLNLGIMSSEHILPLNQSKEYDHEAYNTYLNNYLVKDNVAKNLSLNFPSALNSTNYTLTHGKVERYYEPADMGNGLEKIYFHKLDKEFYAVAHVYGPKIEISFKYRITYDGSPHTGEVSLVISHDAVELQMDLGVIKGRKCLVDQNDNDVFYLYNDELKIVPKYQPDEGSSQEAAEDLVNQLTRTWVGNLYKIIMKVKFERIITNVKATLINDKQSSQHLKHICKTIA